MSAAESKLKIRASVGMTVFTREKSLLQRKFLEKVTSRLFLLQTGLYRGGLEKRGGFYHEFNEFIATSPWTLAPKHAFCVTIKARVSSGGKTGREDHSASVARRPQNQAILTTRQSAASTARRGGGRCSGRGGHRRLPE